MHHKFRKKICSHVTGLTFVAIIFLFGCGGGSSSDSNGTPNPSLTANAGQDQTVGENSDVQLDGSQSADASGAAILTYQWKQLSGPNIVINDADKANASFTAPEVAVDAELVFELTVTNDKGAQDTDDVSILVLDNLPPVADAGDDQQVLANQVVNLDAGGSHDDDGSIASYLWTQVGGSSVVNDPGFDTGSPTPSFTAPASGEKLSFRLTVTDNEGAEDTDQIDVYVTGELFSDDFSHGLDETTWVKVDDSAGGGLNSSIWTTSGNALVQTRYVAERSGGSVFDQSYHKGTYRYLSTTTNLTDYHAQVELKPLANGSNNGVDGNDIGVMFRYQDQDNYYRLSMNARYGFTRLEKKFNGQFSTLAVNSIGYFDDVPMEVVIDAKGDLLQIYIDNDPIFSVRDADLSSGSVALYCQDRAQFDNVLITDASLEPSVVIATPLAYSVATTTSPALNVSANASNLPSGGRIEFLLNDSNSRTDLQAPFTAQYSGLAPGEYTVTAILRDADGNELARDTNLAVGIRGGYLIAAGNSITNGTGDLFAGDNTSADGRIVAIQGYEASLNDQLTDDLNLPQIVFNEGVPGDTTTEAVGRIGSILSRHAHAGDVLLLLGTNDATNGVTSATYLDNMQSLATSVTNAGMTAWIALVPPQYDATTGQPDTARNNLIQTYNAGLPGLTNANIKLGPDLYTFFLNNPSLFYDALHPNSLGHACLAQLWRNAVTGSNTDPFILKSLVAPALYQQNLLEEGNSFYVDATGTLENIPAQLASAVWIMTANADAANTDNSAPFITFVVDRAATVYVAYDTGSALPGWLSSGFTDTGLQVGTSVGPFKLYSKTFGADEEVDLGANRAGGGTGSMNYFVAVQN